MVLWCYISGVLVGYFRLHLVWTLECVSLHFWYFTESFPCTYPCNRKEICMWGTVDFRMLIPSWKTKNPNCQIKSNSSYAETSLSDKFDWSVWEEKVNNACFEAPPHFCLFPSFMLPSLTVLWWDMGENLWQVLFVTGNSFLCTCLSQCYAGGV